MRQRYLKLSLESDRNKIAKLFRHTPNNWRFFTVINLFLHCSPPLLTGPQSPFDNLASFSLSVADRVRLLCCPFPSASHTKVRNIYFPRKLPELKLHRGVICSLEIDDCQKDSHPDKEFRLPSMLRIDSNVLRPARANSWLRGKHSRSSACFP